MIEVSRTPYMDVQVSDLRFQYLHAIRHVSLAQWR